MKVEQNSLDTTKYFKTTKKKKKKFNRNIRINEKETTAIEKLK